MMKKLIGIAAGAGLVLTMTGAALAHRSDDLLIKNTDTDVKNYVTTKADSGDNEIHGMIVGGFFSAPKIRTGAALASTVLSNEVNTTVAEGCGCFDDVTVKNRDTYVKNMITTKADSGDNEIHGKFVSGGKIYTGSATAGLSLSNIVNFTLLGEVD